jgi:hypothetical protein
MKKNVLICSIMRNCEKTIYRYYEQIKSVVQTFPDINFSLSIYENDSTDNTPAILSSLDWTFINKRHIVSDKIGTKSYGSVKEQDRVVNLANARNKAIYDSGMLDDSDYVLFVESDVIYQPTDVGELIYFKEKAELPEVDIVSSISLQEFDGRFKLYDSWGTRRFMEEEIGRPFPKWHKKTFDKYYGTFNCLCLYRSHPFKHNIKFHWYNERTKKFDNDTMVLCENFRLHGYDQIYINYNSRCYHETK